MKLSPKLIFLGTIMKMKKRFCNYHWLLLVLSFAGSCKTAVKEQEDKIYSRHLQLHIPLTIISTRMPDDKSEMNLLLFNNGDELEQMGAKKIIDSLYHKKLIQPLVLVGIHGNATEDYGLGDLASAGNTMGAKAEKYNSFVMDELYPFIKKKRVIRKFRSLAICGNSLAGISAFDIAWQNADKIDKVGIFSGNFNYAGVTAAENGEPVNAVLEKISASRKRPKLQYWLYAAENTDSSILNNTRQLVAIIGKKNISNPADIEIVSDETGTNDMISWRHHFAGFLLWAFGK